MKNARRYLSSIFTLLEINGVCFQLIVALDQEESKDEKHNGKHTSLLWIAIFRINAAIFSNFLILFLVA